MLTSTDPGSLLATLQLADSALPIGRFVHSHGLEAWLRAHPEAREGEISELVEAVVSESVAPLDGVFLAHAHRATHCTGLQALDAALSARKPTPAARSASHSCGRQLATLGSGLARRSGAFSQLAALVEAGDADGNLAIVAGALSHALGIPERAAILSELRHAASALLSASVRLGAMTPSTAQATLAVLAPSLSRAAGVAARLDIEDTSSTTPELELYSLVHGRAEARLFAT